MAHFELSELRDDFNRHLRTFLAHNSSHLQSISPALEPVGVALSEFILDSGKRLRPIFAYAGFVATGKTPDAPAMQAMASLELLQACALIHDDLMDRSETRRGKPAIHKRFESLHQERDFAGSATLFGDAAAILLGDLALVWADHMFHSAQCPVEQTLDAQRIHDEMRIELMAGQFLDVYEQGQRDHNTDRSLNIARYKSGKYTIERPLHFGAALAGESDELKKALSEFGLPLGEAFQLRDDLLGVFGDPSMTGKPAGDDLREGKRTVLISMTHEALSESERAHFFSLFGKTDLDSGEVDTLRAIISSSGADQRVEELISHLTSQCLSALDAEVFDARSREILTSLSAIATKRSA